MKRHQRGRGRASATSVERRISGTFTLREGADGSAPTIVGYASLFNSLSDDLGGFREIIEPGAFTKTLRDGADVRGLFNHDPNYVLGRAKSGTLRLSEDARGLAYELDVPDTQWGRDLVVTMRRGDVNQSSFAFRPIRHTWEVDAATEMRVWRHQEVQLYDVSPVTYPAYPETSSGVRALLRGLAPGELPRGMLMPGMGEGDDSDDWDVQSDDPDVCFVACLIEHYGELLEAAAQAPGGVDHPDALALAEEIISSAPAMIARCHQVLQAIATEDISMAAGRQSTPPQPGHLLDMLQRQLDALTV